ncbi:MAG: hypothetical protein ACJAS4_002814 [Bacteriovoracaceae bacterium]|jgi:hypothetical protein
MFKLMLLVTLTSLSQSGHADSTYNGTRFWLQSSEDVKFLKLTMKREDNIKVILEDVILDKGMTRGSGEYIYQVCVGYHYNDSLRLQRSQEYYGKMPDLSNRYHAPRDKMGCDVNSEELEF